MSVWKDLAGLSQALHVSYSSLQASYPEMGFGPGGLNIKTLFMHGKIVGGGGCGPS